MIYIIWESSRFSGAPVLANSVQVEKTATSLALEIRMQSHLWMIFDRRLQFPSKTKQFLVKRVQT